MIKRLERFYGRNVGYMTLSSSSRRVTVSTRQKCREIGLDILAFVMSTLIIIVVPFFNHHDGLYKIVSHNTDASMVNTQIGKEVCNYFKMHDELKRRNGKDPDVGFFYDENTLKCWLSHNVIQDYGSSRDYGLMMLHNNIR